MIAAHHHRGLPVHKEHLRAAFETRVDADCPAQLLDDALHVEEVDLARRRRPVFRDRRSSPGQGNRVPFSLDRERGAQFEQRDVAAAVPSVVRHRVNQARHERRPEHVELG